MTEKEENYLENINLFSHDSFDDSISIEDLISLISNCTNQFSDLSQAHISITAHEESCKKEKEKKEDETEDEAKKEEKDEVLEGMRKEKWKIEKDIKESLTKLVRNLDLSKISGSDIKVLNGAFWIFADKVLEVDQGLVLQYLEYIGKLGLFMFFANHTLEHELDQLMLFPIFLDKFEKERFVFKYTEITTFGRKLYETTHSQDLVLSLIREDLSPVDRIIVNSYFRILRFCFPSIYRGNVEVIFGKLVDLYSKTPGAIHNFPAFSHVFNYLLWSDSINLKDAIHLKKLQDSFHMLSDLFPDYFEDSNVYCIYMSILAFKSKIELSLKDVRQAFIGTLLSHIVICPSLYKKDKFIPIECFNLLRGISYRADSPIRVAVFDIFKGSLVPWLYESAFSLNTLNMLIKAFWSVCIVAEQKEMLWKEYFVPHVMRRTLEPDIQEHFHECWACLGAMVCFSSHKNIQKSVFEEYIRVYMVDWGKKLLKEKAFDALKHWCWILSNCCSYVEMKRNSTIVMLGDITVSIINFLIKKENYTGALKGISFLKDMCQNPKDADTRESVLFLIHEHVIEWLDTTKTWKKPNDSTLCISNFIFGLIWNISVSSPCRSLIMNWFLADVTKFMREMAHGMIELEFKDCWKASGILYCLVYSQELINNVFESVKDFLADWIRWCNDDGVPMDALKYVSWFVGIICARKKIFFEILHSFPDILMELIRQTTQIFSKKNLTDPQKKIVDVSIRETKKIVGFVAKFFCLQQQISTHSEYPGDFKWELPFNLKQSLQSQAHEGEEEHEGQGGEITVTGEDSAVSMGVLKQYTRDDLDFVSDDEHPTPHCSGKVVLYEGFNTKGLQSEDLSQCIQARISNCLERLVCSWIFGCANCSELYYDASSGKLKP
ncbi:hypothetical protein ADUPG1_008836, partial [Aduncisulcus paluster]